MSDMIDILREAIIKSGLSQRKLGELSGTNRLSIMRFLRGENLLALDQAARIADYLGLELSPKRRRGGK